MSVPFRALVALLVATGALCGGPFCGGPFCGGPFCGGPLGAQDYEFKPAVQWQGRVDATASGRGNTLQLGYGANVPAGYYVRVGVEGAVGLAVRDSRIADATRVDLTSRFLFDPFAEQRIGWYAGGGVSVLHERDGWQPYLTALVGREGPTSGRWRTAVEAGIGGGVRVGLVVRRTRVNGR
jgi:hypothetical protein